VVDAKKYEALCNFAGWHQEGHLAHRTLRQNPFVSPMLALHFVQGD